MPAAIPAVPAPSEASATAATASEKRFVAGVGLAFLSIFAVSICNAVKDDSASNAPSALLTESSAAVDEARASFRADSTALAKILAKTGGWTAADRVLVESLAHGSQFRTPHDPAVHRAGVRVVLDSARSLLKAGRADSAQALLRSAQDPLAPEDAERKRTLAARAEAAAAALAREEADASERSAMAGKWSYGADEDPMTGRTTRRASISSENTVEFDFPHQGAQHATLMVRNHPQYGRDVIVYIERGQILCPSYDDCTVRVRFDDGQPESFTAAGAADHSSTSVFIRNYSRFLQRMRASKVVRIQIPVYQQGRPSFEFQVGGYDHSRYASGSIAAGRQPLP